MSDNLENGMPKGHIERYHPHGLKEGDYCKYLNNRKDTGEDAHVQQAESFLKENFGIICEYATTQSDLRRVFGADIRDYVMFWYFGKPVAREQYRKNLFAFKETIIDLKNRFPEIRLPKTLFIPWDVYETQKKYATATLDKRSDVLTCYLSLGRIYDAKDEKKQGEELVSHIIRHEIGHILSNATMPYLFSKVVPPIGTPEWDNFLKEILGISRYAGTHYEEAIAEIFATVTAPGYKQGTLPDSLESLVDAMIEFRHETSNIAQDSGFDQRDFLKIPIEYLTMFDPPTIPEEGKIEWYDNHYRKMIEFKTHEEMLYYVLSRYLMKKVDIDKIDAAHKGRKWTSWDLSAIVEFWLYLGMTVDEIIAKV